MRWEQRLKYCGWNLYLFLKSSLIWTKYSWTHEFFICSRELITTLIRLSPQFFILKWSVCVYNSHVAINTCFWNSTPSTSSRKPTFTMLVLCINVFSGTFDKRKRFAWNEKFRNVCNLSMWSSSVNLMYVTDWKQTVNTLQMWLCSKQTQEDNHTRRRDARCIWDAANKTHSHTW